MFKGAKKEDLRRIASELELCVSDKLTVLDFTDLIKNCDRYKNDLDSVHELANLIIEERKSEESQQLHTLDKETASNISVRQADKWFDPLTLGKETDLPYSSRGRSITSIVEPDLTNLNENRLDNWQKITKIIQLIWKRWSVDHLNSLQKRNKWHFEKKNAKIGDMVIIKEDNLPSCQWSLGRINNIYQGKDSKKIAMGSLYEKTSEAQNCGKKCLRENSAKFLSEMAMKIDSASYKKKLIAKNATEVKQLIHTQMYELIEILKEREKQLYLSVDEECIDQIAQVDINLAKLSGHCCNTYNFNDNSLDSIPMYDKDPSRFSMMKLDFKSDMKTMKSRLRTFGNLSLHYSNGFENVLPRSSSFSTEPKEDVSSDYAKRLQMRNSVNCFLKFAANDDLAKRMLHPDQASELSDDDIYSMDYREFERDNPLLEDDIEIISENEVSEIPSHSPEFPQKHACRKKLFSGKRSLPVLPCGIFRKNGKDDKVEVENRSSPVVPFSIFQKKVENAGNVKVEKQNNTEPEKESNLPCSSSIIHSPESNTETLTSSEKNKNSVVVSCISTEAKKNEVPSAALASSLFSHFNNNKEEWLASKNDSGKGLSTESASEKGLCSKDGSGKFLLLEKKLSQWLSPKENPGNSSFWLSENPHQCSAKI
ncbi:DUF5641 domain-containing protein [Trichonephila clavipes]|nr:DUF5641 domain-containing protein [Trichonephila clavipes]